MKSRFKGCNIPLEKNTSYVDGWNFAHLFTGIVFGWVMDPIFAIILLALYEPFEIYVLCRFLYKKFGIEFGNETWWNSAIDIVFNTAGVFIGLYILRSFIAPPFLLF